MPEVASLRREDPRQLGEYELDGLIVGGVYAARTASGERVAVKVFRSEPAALVEEIRRLRLPDAYHTVQTLDAGVTDGLPYVVMEYVDGDTLEHAIAATGPLRSAALHRLAISTMTALVALHQAGVVHGAFGPDNVLMGPDGPRVINAGLAQALAAVDGGETRAVRSLAHLAPERFDGAPPEPPADVFAWASTMVFAATGQAPFEGGSMSATTNRILHDEPDLGMLDEHLRGVVGDCLAKDGTARPPAADVLLRLVGHSLLTAAPAELAEALPAPSPDRRRPWRFAALAGVGGLAIAVATAATVYALRPQPSRPVAVAVSRSPSVVTLSAQPTPSPPPAPTGRVTLPGLRATAFENPGDPLRIAAYRVKETVYLRTLGTDQFRATGDKAEDLAVSPDGTWLALLDSGTVTVINRAGGERFTVKVDSGRRPVWANDGKRLLLTLNEGGAKDTDGIPVPTGFTIVDPATRQATRVDTDEETHRGLGQYSWLPDGSGVAFTYQDGDNFGMRVRDLGGRETRALNWVGFTSGGRMFSPSGNLFATNCPSGGTFCVWDLAQGGRHASVGLFFARAEFWGWYDEDHLMVLNPSAEPHQLVVMDMRGQPGRVMLSVAGKDFPNLRVSMARR